MNMPERGPGDVEMRFTGGVTMGNVDPGHFWL
jgi:hypothetical protein